MERIIIVIFLLWCFGCKSDRKDIVKTEIENAVIDTAPVQNNYTENISKAFVLGKFEYKTDSTFVKVSSEHSSKEIYLKNETYDAFLKMLEAAKTDGITFKIISGTRNFQQQKVIWERKWEKYKHLKPLERCLKILEYSSMPSSSRHHWGTDLDLNSLNNSYFNSGKGKQEYDWLVTNANNYGFYQVYTKKDNGRTGYNLEKWHWSYLPLANKYLEFYNIKIESSNIEGFKGSEFAETLNIIKDYVNGVSHKVKNYK